ncbi:MAG: hypothetical protein HQL67_12180 [Magnetococcales bacterium]|nr:hypothetical protein [Magnetococcales bacterium]
MEKLVTKIAFFLTILAAVTPLLASETWELPDLQRLPSKSCKSCHGAIYAQWKGSMHAKSTPLTNPLHRHFYEQKIGSPEKKGVLDPKTKQFPACLNCHAPNAARLENSDLSSADDFQEGVNCTACHTIRRLKHKGGPQVGVEAYEYDNTRFQGPNGTPHGLKATLPPGSGDQEVASNPYTHQANPQTFKDSSDICLGCHGSYEPEKNQPVCSTGTELHAFDKSATCQSCHMPDTEGFVSHAMPGGHNPEMVRQGVSLEVEAEKKNDHIMASVTVSNLLMHRFPTGIPLRQAVIHLFAFGADGQLLWQNFRQDVGQEDPQALLAKPGNSSGAPFDNKSKDSRLSAGEERVLYYRIPKPQATLFRAEIHYHLIPETLAKSVTTLPAEIRTPILLTSAEATL